MATEGSTGGAGGTSGSGGSIASGGTTSTGGTGGVAPPTRAPVEPGLGNPALAAGDFAELPLLSQTGVLSDLVALTPNAAFLPYEPNAKLWSDSADKTRWIAVPNDGAPYAADEQIAFSELGLWTFPEGTVTMKHFELVVNEVTSERIRLETRVGVVVGGAFVGASYRWRGDGTDADLVETMTSEVMDITTSSGTVPHTHTFPGLDDCSECHRSTAGTALGVRTHQLNGEYTYPSGYRDNQLVVWGELGLLSEPFDELEIASYSRTVDIHDTTASLETRARSYFEANCSPCHHPGGANQSWDARYVTPLANQDIIGNVVTPGDPDASNLYKRMSYATVDTPKNAKQMMPPLAKNHVDTFALGVIEQWISSLP